MAFELLGFPFLRTLFNPEEADETLLDPVEEEEWVELADSEGTSFLGGAP